MALKKWRYLTIIKGLPAEYGALTDLDADIAVTPLVQLGGRQPALDHDEDDDDDDELSLPAFDSPGQGTWLTNKGQEHWLRLYRLLLARKDKRWPDDRPVLVDGGWLDDAETFQAVLDNARAFGRRLLPVTGLGRTGAYQEVASSAARQDGLGLVVRVSRKDLELGPTILGEQITALLRDLGQSSKTADLVIDLGEVPALFKERDEMTVEALLRSWPDFDDWRNVAVVATNMPRNGRGYPQGDIVPFARSEWWLNQQLLSRSSQLARVPAFGDYGVLHPDPLEKIDNPKALPRIPWILYSLNGKCLSIRARDLSRNGTVDDLRRLLVQLRDDGDWCGEEFSTGDAWIGGIIAGSKKAGNWYRWRRVGLAHHWTYVSRQLTNLGAP